MESIIAADHDNINLRVASFACYLDTAKENLVHKVSSHDLPFLLHSPKNSYSSKENRDSLTNLRVDSFSYLNTSGEKNFVFNIPGPIKDHPNTPFNFSQENPIDGEISIFGADKYFNMKLEYNAAQKHESKNEGPVIMPRRGSNYPGPRTPRSLCSEVNSWDNTQNALTQNILQRNGSSSERKPKKGNFGKRFFSGFGCQGPCFDNKDVGINGNVTRYGSKSNRTVSERIALEKSTVKNEVANLNESRNSIEVFGFGQNGPTSSTMCDDMASEASSDLFEIENISGSIHPILASTQDHVSVCTNPISHYAPSEASIQWSVVTADNCSVSDYYYNDEKNMSIVEGDIIMSRNHNNSTKKSTKIRNGGGKEAGKSRAGGLLGCKSQKSVDVAENVCCNIMEKQ
ncbi:hypothetical protein DH2020_043220 [Rehmannia glutinosa]|uniref:Uncharacterized protein n=1 Tax=Rehmannia glutinosa TaxID=99300 RepID=A0ABR0UK86_REHGL